MHLQRLLCVALPPLIAAQCPDYTTYSAQYHAPFSSGRYNLSSQRPDSSCRTFSLPVVEDAISNVSAQIADPDLARLFQNAFPSTLDTTVKWKGTANDTGEELTFVITGDIDAMWLRDSANQMHSYSALLTPSTLPDSLASLYRGVINLQARYILTAPFCQSFQPPTESGLAPSVNSAASSDAVFPAYPNASVFECKYELDSLAAFLQVSTDYFSATGDGPFFGSYSWVSAVQAVLQTANEMMITTYSANGSVNANPYAFTRQSNRATETLSNDGAGNPTQNGTGLIRSAFRPSDDATIYQFLIPSNMQFSHFLAGSADIMEALNTSTTCSLASQMRSMADTIRAGISAHAIVKSAAGDDVFAYEIDGYGSANIMDDANIPSLLSTPLIGYLNSSDPIYASTREMILSTQNPYWATGPVISAVGGPHDGPGHAWPMAAIVRALTSTDDDEIADQIRMILASTDGLGLIHESIWAYDASQYTRPWFAWANGLFGQLIVQLAKERPQVLQRSYQ
ncbi:hypothetical protein ANO11243_031500 [Dothideomycetidae sp. 11243]|nr:hypothetical protein ANO11243_031500 [fungal sp. No.11243]